MKQTVLVLALCLMISGCNKTDVDTFVAPQFGSTKIQKVAILPFTNVRITPQQSLEINKKMSLAVDRMNPGVEIIAPSAAEELISAADLAGDCATFLRDYHTSGIPNGKTLQAIGRATGADAIIQGSLIGLEQKDGSFWTGASGTSRVMIQFCLFNTSEDNNSRLLWASSCRAKREKNAFSLSSSAPSIYKTLDMAVDKILHTIPVMGSNK